MKWRGTLAGALTVGVVLTWLACGRKSDLRRTKAKDLIAESRDFTRAAFRARLTPQELQEGLRLGFWTKDAYFWDQYHLTASGAVHFTYAEDHNQILLGSPPRLRKPVGREVVEVTGVRDGSGMLGPPGTVKVVEFTWKWNWHEIPDQVKTVLGPEPKEAKGSALLRLYDDGWRVDSVEANPE